LNYLTPEDERMVFELLVILLFMPVLRLIVGIIGILGLFNEIERISRNK
jgi:hypothetical protein